MSDITINSKNDWDNGKYESTSADIDDESGNVGIGYPSAQNLDDIDSNISDILDKAIIQVRFDDETADDVSGEENDGSIEGDPDFESGVLGTQCISLDGEEDYISFGAVSNIPLENLKHKTFSFWTKLRSTNRGYWITARDDTDEDWFRIENDGDDYIRVFLIDSLDQDWEWHSDSIPLDEWVHVAVVGRDEIIEVYVNGELSGSNEGGERDLGSIDLTQTDHDLEIGREKQNDRRYIDAAVNDFFLFDKELSEDEIELLYFNGHENDNFEGDYTSEVFEPEDGQDVEHSDIEVTADIGEDASAEIKAIALDDEEEEIDSTTISIDDGTNTYDISDLDDSPKIQFESTHEVDIS